MDSSRRAGPPESEDRRGATTPGPSEAPGASEVLPSTPSDRMAPTGPNNYSETSPSGNGGPTLVQQAPEQNPRPSSPVEVWVHRSWIVMYVVFCIWIGIVVATLPWTRVWTDNSIVIAYPGLRAFLQQNFVRGVVTGVGLLDLWLGIWEAVHYREQKA